jgi:hypothetical protein
MLPWSRAFSGLNLVLRTPPCDALESGVRDALATPHDVIDAGRALLAALVAPTGVGDVNSRPEAWLGNIAVSARPVQQAKS